MRHDPVPESATAEQSVALSSVAALAAAPEWTVTAGTKRRWSTAERVIDANDSRWVVGLTPTVSDATALIVWRDDSVVGHARGAEADMCRIACRWAANLFTDRQWSS